MAGTLLAITRQLLELEKCSNHVRIRETFSFDLKKISVLGMRFSWGNVTSRGVFRFYGQFYPALGANPISQFFGSGFLETSLSSESLEPLIGFLAYLEPTLLPKQHKMFTNSTPTNANLGWITPIFYMAIIRRQNMLESCSSPPKTR